MADKKVEVKVIITILEILFCIGLIFGLIMFFREWSRRIDREQEKRHQEWLDSPDGQFTMEMERILRKMVQREYNKEHGIKDD